LSHLNKTYRVPRPGSSHGRVERRFSKMNLIAPHSSYNRSVLASSSGYKKALDALFQSASIISLF
jgi:hypothetical protein